MRILIAGVPRSGKTTFAEELSWYAQDLPNPPTVYSTDDNLPIKFKDNVHKTFTWLEENQTRSWIIEGVVVVEIIKMWIERYPTRPWDTIYFLKAPIVALTPEQKIMAKGITTAWNKLQGIGKVRYLQITKK